MENTPGPTTSSVSRCSRSSKNVDLLALAEQHRTKWETRGPADVRNIGPSIRDFERYVSTERAELSVVGEKRGSGNGATTR